MRIAVAGGGIAGLTAAIALAARGFSVALFERAAQLEEIGAGIQLSPNAMAVLERLGVTPPSKGGSPSRRRSSSAARGSGAYRAAAARQDGARALRRALLHASPRRSAERAPRNRTPATRRSASTFAPRCATCGRAEKSVVFTAGGLGRKADVLDRRRRHPFACAHRLFRPSRAEAARPQRLARGRCRRRASQASRRST